MQERRDTAKDRPSDDEIKKGIMQPLDIARKRFAEFMASDESPAIHNFDGNEMRQWQLTSAATSTAIRADDIPEGHIIEVRYVYCHYIDMANQATGEVKRQIRTALITPKGEVYGFVAGGVANSVQQMVDSFGLNPFDPPLRVKSVEQKTRMGFRTRLLVPVL